jgi:hypothetical protein
MEVQQQGNCVGARAACMQERGSMRDTMESQGISVLHRSYKGLACMRCCTMALPAHVAAVPAVSGQHACNVQGADVAIFPFEVILQLL